MKRLIHKVKFFILLTISSILEKFKLVSMASGPLGTFDGEEFIFYQEYFFEWRFPLVVLDIGANTGLWATDFLEAARNRLALIHAVEPIPEFIKMINDNGNSQIRAHHFAIGEDFGEVKIARIGNGGTSFPNTDSDYPDSSKEIFWHTVPTISGDSLVKQLNIKPDLIKIDTDGFDFNIIKSLHGTLVSCRPILQFEFTYRFAKKANYSLRDVIDYLSLRNYKTFVIASNGNLESLAFPRLEVLNHQTKNFIALPK